MQLEVCMRQLEDTSSDALVVLTALEAVARLAWSDDEVREEVAQMEGTPSCSHTRTDMPSTTSSC